MDRLPAPAAPFAEPSPPKRPQRYGCRGSAATAPGLRNWVRDMALRASPKALLDCHRALTSADFRAELREVRVPTLVIHGERDATCPLDLTGRPTAALVPGVRLLIYEGAPHGLFLTHRDRLNADLLAFARGA